jgi:hypothetical protein
MALGVDAGQRGKDVVGGVRDQRGVVVGKESAIAFQEVEQVRHLLEVGRNVRVVSAEVDIVKLNVM